MGLGARGLDSRLAELKERASLAETQEEKLTQLRTFAVHELCGETLPIGALESVVRQLREVAKNSGVGTAGVASFRGELLELRHRSLQEKALRAIDNPDARESDRFAAIAFLARQGDEFSLSQLRQKNLADVRMEQTKVAALRREDLQFKPAGPTISEIDFRQPETVQSASLKRAYSTVRKAVSVSGAIVRASDLVRTTQLSLWEIHWALEDLSVVGALARFFQAVQASSSEHTHRSEESSDWRTLLGVPVPCIGCSIRFVPRTNEVFAFYKKRS